MHQRPRIPQGFSGIGQICRRNFNAKLALDVPKTEQFSLPRDVLEATDRLIEMTPTSKPQE